jgi:hypothetical protein
MSPTRSCDPPPGCPGITAGKSLASAPGNVLPPLRKYSRTCAPRASRESKLRRCCGTGVLGFASLKAPWWSAPHLSGCLFVFAHSKCSRWKLWKLRGFQESLSATTPPWWILALLRVGRVDAVGRRHRRDVGVCGTSVSVHSLAADSGGSGQSWSSCIMSMRFISRISISF